MNDICTYRVELRGQIDEAEINALSPLQVGVDRVEPAATFLTVVTDQSGLIGLMRHLHGLGLVLQSVCRVEAA